ncbi:MAG TPA: DEAD/DEAH box helicase [Actinobacteria bacterium]|jgi:ATP-dependent RNA helicase DeaD|nr:DEAD/DEAH box helicase [Actinomycetota bacterium]
MTERINKAFKELGIKEELLRAIKELGFEQLTPIQEKAIPVLKKGDSDFIGLAQTGTGKTAAFGIPLAELVNINSKNIEALILAPTRELCMQIANDIGNYCRYLKQIKIAAIYGGASIETQINKIKKGVHIVVATPGRLNDLIRRKKINISNIKYVLLDEADEMLNMGFQEDIDAILDLAPKEKHTWLFAATMPDEIHKITKKYMNDPVELTIGVKNAAAENIEHLYCVIHEKDRYTALKRIIDFNPDIFSIVFCRTKAETQEIAEKLIKDGYNADSLHGDLSQAQRDKVMKHYRNRNLQLLVATDVAARGIDISDVSHVINYRLPDEIEIYTHRSGRTARAGKSGITISIINIKDIGRIKKIEKHLNKKFIYTKVPDGVEICEQQMLSMIKKIKKVEINHAGIQKYLGFITEELQNVDKVELIKRIVSLEFNRFLDYYRDAKDLNIDFSKKDRIKQKNSSSKTASIFINLGSMDGFSNGKMLKYLKEITGLSNDIFGRINIKGVYSFIGLKNDEYLDDILQSFQRELYRGRKVRVDDNSMGGKSKGAYPAKSFDGSRVRKRKKKY